MGEGKVGEVACIHVYGQKLTDVQNPIRRYPLRVSQQSDEAEEPDNLILIHSRTQSNLARCVLKNESWEKEKKKKNSGYLERQLGVVRCLDDNVDNGRQHCRFPQIEILFKSLD